MEHNYTLSVYLPEKPYESGISKAYQYHHLRDIIKPSVSITVFPAHAKTIVINFPGYNSDRYGFDNVFLQMAENISHMHTAAIVLSDNMYLRGYDNQKLLLEKGRAVLDYVVEHAEEISGTPTPSIYLIGTSAGGSLCSAIAWEYPLIRRVLLINPSGDVPESIMRNTIARFNGRLVIANGRCDYSIGPQSGRYLGSMAVEAAKIRYVSLPATSHSFHNAYSRQLVALLPVLLFTDRFIFFPPRNVRFFFHIVMQVPSIILRNLFPSLVSIVHRTFEYITQKFSGFVNLVSVFHISSRMHALARYAGKRYFLSFFLKIQDAFDYPHALRTCSRDQKQSIVFSIFKSACYIQDAKERHDYLHLASRFCEHIFTSLSATRTYSFISDVWAQTAYGLPIFPALLNVNKANHFFNVCRYIDAAGSGDIDENIRQLSSVLFCLSPALLNDQRLWKTLHSFFIQQHHTSTLHMLFTIVLHQSSFNLQNDYFWLLLDHILLQEEKPRSLLASYLELSKISNTEISKEILAGVHLAKNDREFLMVMLQKISHDTLVRIIDDERFLEHILVISKIKSKPSRSFYYAFLARYLSIMPAEEKATKAGLNILIKVFAFLQSHIKNQNDQNFYDILTAYIIHVSYDKISDTVFLEALILNAQEFYRHIQHYEESIDDVTEYLSFLPAGDADCKQYFRYFTQYYISFSKDAKQTLFHLKEMHLLLFHYIDDAHFPELLTTVKTVVFSQPLSQASGLDMFLLYPDVILRLLSLKIHRCTYSDINAFIQKIQPDMIPLTESAVNSVMTLIGIPISITSKHKLIIYLAHITVPLMISDQRLRDAFSRLTIDEILRLLEMKLPDIKTGHTNHKRIFMFIIEAAILSEASPRYDVHITRLIKKFGLHFSDSVIIEKFQRRTKLENEITRDISHFHTSIVSMMVDYYITGKPGRIIELAGIEHYKKIVQTLHEYDQHLHTSRGYPYYLPTKRKNGFYGLWRVVSPKALKNYLQYGHEINKSESRYTYLALKRSECFSLPDVYGFMVWIPAYVYNNFAVKSKVQTSVRERSTEEVVIDDDIPAENLKIFFVSEEIYRAHEKQFKDFSVLRLHAFTAYYRTTLRAPVTRYFRWNELRDVISIINSHQKERGARLAVIYAKSENLKKLKKTFSRRVFKETFPEYYINDIKKSSLIHHLQQYIITQPYGLLHLFTQNAYRRGVPRIKKTIRKGFNQGYLVLIQKKKFYGKTYDEPDRIRAEYLSWCIYKETGALVKDDVRLLHIEGRLILAGRWIHAPLYQTQRVPIEDLALDFILSCLIQDRDQGKPDNYLYVRHTIMAFDFGGSFMFRSIGGKKGKDGQLPFGLKNFKDMIRTDSFHFRKDMYRHLESFPKELESAMHRVVISLSPRIIEQHVHAAGFSDLTLANEIILVLNQSRNYLIHRLAFVFLQQRRINDIPLKLEYVFDILNTDVSPVILEDAVEKRLSSAQSIRHLMPAFHHLSSLTAGEATGKNLTGYQTRVLGTGRYISLLQRNENGPELSFEEMNTVSARLGAGQYEKAIISWMRTHAGFVDDIMAICTRQNTSFLEKAENVQAYISGIFGKSTFSDDINPEIFIHDLLSVCCYFANSSAQQYHYFAITNLERYRYNLSENLLHTSLDI